MKKELMTPEELHEKIRDIDSTVKVLVFMNAFSVIIISLFLYLIYFSR